MRPENRALSRVSMGRARVIFAVAGALVLTVGAIASPRARTWADVDRFRVEAARARGATPSLDGTALRFVRPGTFFSGGTVTAVEGPRDGVVRVAVRFPAGDATIVIARDGGDPGDEVLQAPPYALTFERGAVPREVVSSARYALAATIPRDAARVPAGLRPLPRRSPAR